MHHRVSVSRAFLQGYLLFACCLGGAIAASGQTQTAGLAGTWAGVLRSSARDLNLVLDPSCWPRAPRPAGEEPRRRIVNNQPNRFFSFLSFNLNSGSRFPPCPSG